MRSFQSTRRGFLGAAAGLGYASRSGFGRTLPLRIGITDWNLNLEADSEAVPRAANLGFQGIQVSFGRKIIDGKMTVDRPDVIARYRRASQQYRIPIDGTCVARLHDNGLKS
ncbi:MAG: sugar phosphate isomerase/epimerase family protein, partial [Bryobacteraceae bacterium]